MVKTKNKHTYEIKYLSSNKISSVRYTTDRNKDFDKVTRLFVEDFKDSDFVIKEVRYEGEN